MADPPAQAQAQAVQAGMSQIFAPLSNLPLPKMLSFNDNLATTWKSWKQAWKRYEIATGMHKQGGVVRVSTLLSIIGEDGVNVHDTFTWNEGKDQNDIELVLQKFDQFCAPRTQVIYERYRFNNRNQEPGENITSYLTELRTIARNCAHDTITPDEILRDRLVLGICDDRVRERLLCLNDLTLQQAVDQIKSSEQTQQRVKQITGRASSRGRRNRVSTVHETADPKQDPYYIGSVAENKPQARMAVIKLQISSPTPETEVQFQIDTGSQCDILPIWIYKQVTGDSQLQRLKPCQKEIVSYTGEHRKITGKVNPPVWSGRHEKSLDFNIIDGDYQPILSLNTSVGLGFVSLHNCNVLAIHVDSPSTTLQEEFTDVFEGLGALPGKYQIVIDENIPPCLCPETSASGPVTAHQRKA